MGAKQSEPCPAGSKPAKARPRADVRPYIVTVWWVYTDRSPTEFGTDTLCVNAYSADDARIQAEVCVRGRRFKADIRVESVTPAGAEPAALIEPAAWIEETDDGE